MSAFHVSCAIEDNYAAHSAAMFDSVLGQLPGERVEVHYLVDPGFSRRAEERLSRLVVERGASVDFVRVADERCAGLPIEGFTRKATWYRIFLPELLAELDKVLHLDADLIAMAPLAPLWEIDLGGDYLAAVTNVFERHWRHWPAELGLAGEDSYFNAGVMLMNLEAMRREDCSAAMRDFAVTQRDRYVWRDQDVLNAILAPRRRKLAPRWNCMNSIVVFPWSAELFDPTELAHARRAPAIRHFEGPGVNKPWHYLCEREMRELYFKHRRATPWPRVKMVGRTPANMLRRHLRHGRDN